MRQCTRRPASGASTIALTGILALLITGAVRPASAQDDGGRIAVAGDISIIRLLDLAAEQTGRSIRYEPEEVRGNVTVRAQNGLTRSELWDTAQRALARAGKTTVLRPGETILDVVNLNEAKLAARVERVWPPEDDAGAGFAVVLIEPEFLAPDQAKDFFARIMSPSIGSAELLGDGRRVLLADLRPRVDQAIMLFEEVDSPRQDPQLRRIAAQHLSANELAALVLAASARTDALAGRQRLGTLIPGPDNAVLLLVAPRDEQESWLALIESFDVPPPVTTRTYLPNSFELSRISSMLESVVRDSSPGGSGARWRVAVDDIGGALIVTATESEHAAITAMLERLESAPAAVRSSVRSFIVRNRDAEELLEVVGSLLEIGAFDSDADGEAGAGADPSNRPRRRSDGSQRSLIATPGTDQAGTPAPDGEPRRRVRRLSDDDLTLTLDPSTSTIIAVGNARRLDQVAEIIDQLDVRQPQVMIEILAVSLSDSDLLDLGVELDKLEISGATQVSLSSLFGLVTRPDLTQPTPPTGAQGFSGIALSPGDFSIVIRALQSINQGRTLVLPKVLVNNEEEAVLDSVLQEPLQTTNASDTVATTGFAGTQDAGTTVNVLPSIAAGDYLVLDYEISLSNFVGDSASPTLPPPRQQNRLQSVVTIPDSYTVVVGGFENQVATEAESRIPVLGGIPLIGELFKNRSKTQSTARFFVFIRATILRHGGFEDLKYISNRDSLDLGVDDETRQWPTVSPRMIRP